MPRHPHYVPHGVIPAVLLPFNDDLSIDEKSFRGHLRDVAAATGLSAVTINAHSTEVASCSFDEQRRVLDITQDEIGARLPIINGIWADGSLEAARIARMAAEGGASALLVFPPAPFTLQQSPEMALAHFKRIADASDLPIIVFQYPLATGQGYPRDTLLKMCEQVPSDPRHQGLGRQRAAARDAYPHAAEPGAAGERAHHPQRVAVLLAGARLQRAPLRQRQRDRRSAGPVVPRGGGQRPRRGEAPQRPHLSAGARVLCRALGRHAQPHEGGAGAARPSARARWCGRRWSSSAAPRSSASARRWWRRACSTPRPAATRPSSTGVSRAQHW